MKLSKVDIGTLACLWWGKVRRAVPKAYRQAAATGVRRTGAYAVPGLLIDEEE